MINLNKRIEITSSAYIPQVKCKGSKHYDTKFFYNYSKFRSNVSK